MTEQTTREARTQLILIATAIAVGGIVFALAGDFVMGVGVGAAVFALTRQALKVWGRKTRRPTPRASVTASRSTSSQPQRDP